MFSLLVVQLTFPTFIMGWVVALVQRGAASMQRLDELLSVEPAIADHPEPETPDPIRGELELRRLTVVYPGSGEARALDDVSLRVPAGTTLGVVGPVGSGKTTLASVIPRLHEFPDGSVFVDGVDVNRIPLHTLRSHIAMVPQESFLFSLTLADNVAFGLERTELGAREPVGSFRERRNRAADLGRRTRPEAGSAQSAFQRRQVHADGWSDHGVGGTCRRRNVIRDCKRLRFGFPSASLLERRFPHPLQGLPGGLISI